MSFFGVLFKPFKKLVKKIGKGIKKVAKKIGKAVGKLGIVGQIGMMFLMPYAVGALGSFFGASGTLSSWGATLLKSSNIGARALGHTLNAVNTVGTMAGKAYTTVTNTISNAFNSVVNTGKKGLTKMGFGKGVNVPADVVGGTLPEAPSFYADKPATFMDKVGSIKPDSLAGGENFTENLFKGYEKSIAQGDSRILQGLQEAQGIREAAFLTEGGIAKGSIDYNSLLSPEKTVADMASSNITATMAPPVISNPSVTMDVAGDTLIAKGKSFLSEQVQAGFTSAKEKLGAEIQNVITAPVDAITGKASEIAKVKTLEMLGIEEPVQGAEHGTYNPTPLLAGTDSGIDFTNSYVVDSFAKQGNNHLAYGIANRGYVGNLFDPQNNPTANDFMSQYYVGANVNRQLGVA